MNVRVNGNGAMDWDLPGVALRGVRCCAALEERGQVELTLGEAETGEGMVRVPLTSETHRLSGELILRKGEDFFCVEASLRAGKAEMGYPITFACTDSLTVCVEAIEGCDALLAEALSPNPWWTNPFFPKSLRDVPARTQLLLARTRESCLFMLPLVGERFKTELHGGEGGLEIALNAYNCGYDRLEGTLLALSADEDPFTAVENGYARCVEAGLIRTRLKAEKEYPEMMEYLGWCSWNAFYHEVSAQGLLDKLEELKRKGVPVGWVLIDDGWSPTQDGRLTALTEDPEKFPEGLKGFIKRAHEQYGVGQVGVWHAFNGYWQGIEENSALARRMSQAFSRTKSGHLLPGFKYIQSFEFFNTWHRWLRDQGVDFVKVDNQSSLINFVRSNVPVDAIAQTHQALEDSVKLNFTAPLINCMGMANEDAFNREYSAVARNSDDFFPNREGGFISHLMQNAFNSIFYDQLYVCDYDMWWTQHPSAQVSAVLRAISGGPIYISDKVGETDPAMLRPLVEADGRIIRCDHAARPAASCLFEDVRETTGVLKITNRCGANAVTAAFNLTDGEKACCIALEDTECEKGTEYLAYLHFARRYARFDRPIELTLAGGAAEVISLYPIENGEAVVGAEDKYISAGSRDTHRRAAGSAR